MGRTYRRGMPGTVHHLPPRMDAAMRLLPFRERYVIEQRYHLDGGRGMTYEQLGERLGITRERVHELERQGLGFLKARVDPARMLRFRREVRARDRSRRNAAAFRPRKHGR